MQQSGYITNSDITAHLPPAREGCGLLPSEELTVPRAAAITPASATVRLGATRAYAAPLPRLLRQSGLALKTGFSRCALFAEHGAFAAAAAPTTSGRRFVLFPVTGGSGFRRHRGCAWTSLLTALDLSKEDGQGAGCAHWLLLASGSSEHTTNLPCRPKSGLLAEDGRSPATPTRCWHQLTKPREPLVEITDGLS
jgi:hypothetical protein